MFQVLHVNLKKFNFFVWVIQISIIFTLIQNNKQTILSKQHYISTYVQDICGGSTYI